MILSSQPIYLTPEQAASQLGLSVKTLANWRVSGRGPNFHKVGRCVRYEASNLQQWVAAQTFNSTSQASLSSPTQVSPTQQAIVGGSKPNVPACHQVSVLLAVPNAISPAVTTPREEALEEELEEEIPDQTEFFS